MRREAGGRLLRVAAAAIVGYGVSQVFSSLADEDPHVRDFWMQDLLSIVVMALIATAIAVTVIRVSADATRAAQVRGVAGLAVAAILVTPLFWFSAAPMILAAGAYVLGSTTGGTNRDGGSTPARILVLIAGLLVLATVAVIIGGSIVELL